VNTPAENQQTVEAALALFRKRLDDIAGRELRRISVALVRDALARLDGAR